jgi:hypothetical protein
MSRFVVPNQPNLNQGDVIPGEPFLVRDLRSTHPYYADEWSEWTFLTAAYEGVRQLVDIGVVKQHEREDDPAFLRRMTELYGLNYSRAVIDLVNHYLFKKEPTREIPKQLAEDPAWIAFLDDCNLYGDKFGDLLADQARWSSVMGHVGFLIDKPLLAAESKQQELAQGIYPYISVYHPPAILDWEYARDITGRPRLSFIKLLDDSDGTNTYRFWWQDHWELWREPESEEEPSEEAEAVKIGEGENPLGEIPFVWLHNLSGRFFPLGVSDIHEIARIDLSIIRDLSQISEIAGFNAFPVLMAPMLEEGLETQDDIGPTAVIEFDPENPQAKPSWLVPAAEGVLRALWEGIKQKGEECYRIANAGGLHAVDTASVAKSGTALSAEFQQLNAKIVQKAVNVEKTENMILYFWLRWQNLEQLIEESAIIRARDYDVHNLSQDLADALTAKAVVRSTTFKQEVEKVQARNVLPTADDETMEQIDTEIMEAERDLPELYTTNAQEPATQAAEPGGAPKANPFIADGSEEPTEDEE